MQDYIITFIKSATYFLWTSNPKPAFLRPVQPLLQYAANDFNVHMKLSANPLMSLTRLQLSMSMITMMLATDYVDLSFKAAILEERGSKYHHFDMFPTQRIILLIKNKNKPKQNYVLRRNTNTPV